MGMECRLREAKRVDCVGDAAEQAMTWGDCAALLLLMDLGCPVEVGRADFEHASASAGAQVVWSWVGMKVNIVQLKRSRQLCGEGHRLQPSPGQGDSGR